LASLERGRVPSPRPIAVKEVPLVDRTEEMNALKEAVYKAVHGEGGLVFVHGEAGIGKTRLVRELGAYAQSRGVQVLYGRCPALFRMDGVPPFILWKEVIKDYLETCTSEQLYRVIGYYPAEVAKLVPELGQKLRTISQSFPISPEQEQNRLFEAVSQFITNISQETPLLVILDDLQWTDPSSLLLLHYLARGAQKTSLLILGAYRSTDIDDKHPLTPVLAELNRERLPQEIQLKRMSLSDISEMIKNILEQEDVPEEFCKIVYDKTRGNPFFAEEVVKSLKEEGDIYLEEGKWKFKEISSIEFPKSVKNIIKARFSRLEDEYQNVLTFASFVGNDFTLEAMCALTGIEEDKLLEIMDRLIKTGFVKHTVIRGEDICSFADIIMRDVVYEEVGPFKRKKLHGVVGTALEKVYADKVDEHLGELALHFLESGDKEKALDYFLKAGKRAQNVYAHNEAVSCLQHILELLEEKEGNLEQKASIMGRLGDIKELMGETSACMECWDRSLTLWDQLGDKKSVARLHVKMAYTLWDEIGDKDKASEHHQLALEILEKEPESVELASLYEDIAHMLWRTGEPSEVLSWTQKALEIAERLGNPEVLARCYNNLAALAVKSGELEKATRYYEQGLKIDLENNLLGHAILLHYNLLQNYWNDGDFQKAFETAQKGSELAKRVGDVKSLSMMNSVLGVILSAHGEVQKGISMLEDCLALDKRTKSTTHISGVMRWLGRLYVSLGEWDKGPQYLRGALDIAKKVGEYQDYGGATSMLGDVYMEMEDYAEAEKYYNESNSINKKAGDTNAQLSVSFPALSILYMKKGETEKARELIEKTYEYAVKTKSRLSIADAEVLKAMLFREQKDWNQSIQYFEKSLQGYKSLNMQIWYVWKFAELLYEYGLMYLERNEEGDKEKAYSLLNQALEIYRKMDAKKRIEKVEARIALIETGREVSKPKLKLTDFVSAGYADLDKLLYGGIPSGYTLVLTSPSCNERDLLIRSFLETGAKDGEVTFYVTIDASAAKALAEKFVSNLQLFVCNPEADAILKSSPNVHTLKGVENLTDISITLTSAIRQLDPSLKGPRRICLGMVSDVLLQHHAVETRRWLSALLTKLKSEDFTTLGVIDSQVHSSEELHAIVGLFDGEISIYERETDKGLGKFLKIKRMSNQKYREDELPLRRENLE